MKKGLLRKILCAVSILAGAVLIEYYGGAASYLLFYTTLLIPALSFVYRKIAAGSIRVHFMPEKADIVKGEHCPCVLSVVNEGKIPFPNVKVQLTGGKFSFVGCETEFNCSLKPDDILKIPLELDCSHCGSGKVGAESIKLYDIFGFGFREFKDMTRIGVRPRMPHLKDLVIAPGEEKERRKSGWQYKPADVPDGQIKPYVSGDDLRRVHWKATALQGRLMMRSFVTEPKTEVVIIPDTRKELPEGKLGWAAEDAILEGVLAIADYYRRSSTPIRVVSGRGKSMSLTSGAGYERLYDMCCGDFFSGSDRPDAVLDSDIRSSGAGGSYILITWELDGNFVRSLSMAIELGARVSVLYICDDADEATKALMSSDRRIEFLRVPSNADILDILGGTETTGGTGE